MGDPDSPRPKSYGPYGQGQVALQLGYLHYHQAFANEAARQDIYDHVTALVDPPSTKSLGGSPAFPLKPLNDLVVYGGLLALLRNIVARVPSNLWVGLISREGGIMRQPGSVSTLEDLGRVRLSQNFFMRDMLYSEIANFYGIPNIPDDPDLAIAAGTRLCEDLLEPIWTELGRISIRSAFRSCAVNQAGVGKHNCARNEANYAAHIWDRRDADGFMGATACIVVHSFIPYFQRTGHWQALAWWVHDNLPSNAGLTFFVKLGAFNISWHERPVRSIYSYASPKGWLTKPGMDNYEGSHAEEYRAWIEEAGVGQ